MCAARYASIASVRSGTLWKMPRRIALSVSRPKKISTRFSHELEVAVKCS